MPFTKLDSGIIRSSLWSLPSDERIVWITLLAMADEEGFVSTSFSGLVRAANVPPESTKSAIDNFEKPDQDSRTNDNDGIRIRRVDGGWLILNYPKYRERTDKDFHREKMRRYRNKCSTTKSNCSSTVVLPSASVSASASTSEGKEIKEKGEQDAGSVPTKKKPKTKRITEKFTIPTIAEVTDFCKERNIQINPESFHAYYESNGWRVGKNPMKSWKAAIITWKNNNFPNQQSTPKPNLFTQPVPQYQEFK
jgi:hypothetical protein